MNQPPYPITPEIHNPFNPEPNYYPIADPNYVYQPQNPTYPNYQVPYEPQTFIKPEIPSYYPESYSGNPIFQYHQQFKDDQTWVNGWLKSKLKAIKERPKPEGIKIGQAQLALKKSLNILKQMKAAETVLKNNVDNLSNANWEKQMVEFEKQKALLLSLMKPFENEAAVQNLQKEVKARLKKRNMCKEKKVKRREVLKNVYNRHQQLHESIDRWLEEQKEQVDRVKRAETMKRDADCILADVNRKKADGRRQLSLIGSLIKLRAVRERAAESRGERISLDDSNTFATIAERLIKMWEKTVGTYAIEEHGLKVMLENRLDDKPVDPDMKIKNIIKEWDFALFGSKFVPSSAYWVMTFAQKDIETFIALRKSWDTFITAYETGSKIPIGWILPDAPSSPEWEKYLDKQ